MGGFVVDNVFIVVIMFGVEQVKSGGVLTLLLKSPINAADDTADGRWSGKRELLGFCRRLGLEAGYDGA